jgi:hypothetical protein
MPARLPRVCLRCPLEEAQLQIQRRPPRGTCCATVEFYFNCIAALQESLSTLGVTRVQKGPVPQIRTASQVFIGCYEGLEGFTKLLSAAV